MSDRVAGWTAVHGHPEDGVSANCDHHFSHHSGISLTLWSDVEPDSAMYNISEDEKFAVEVVRKGEDDEALLFGDAYEELYEAEAQMLQLMAEYARKEK